MESNVTLDFLINLDIKQNTILFFNVRYIYYIFSSLNNIHKNDFLIENLKYDDADDYYKISAPVVPKHIQ